MTQSQNNTPYWLSSSTPNFAKFILNSFHWVSNQKYENIISSHNEDITILHGNKSALQIFILKCTRSSPCSLIHRYFVFKERDCYSLIRTALKHEAEQFVLISNSGKERKNIISGYLTMKVQIKLFKWIVNNVLSQKYPVEFFST